ncbi:MAG: flagellar basal body L-ring protein FlgH [Alphaproteobacteria bacterium]|nr:flagellar basal body L-ring protein FlgH [Alphaproteobacteria bacterium]
MTILLSGCNLAEQLSTVGDPPPLSQIQDPTRVSGYQPISMPMPQPTLLPGRGQNSLWETGSRAFFKDQRANKVGDIVTVLVNIDQKESIEMTPNIQRTTSGNTTVTNALGLETQALKMLPKKQQGAPGVANPNWLNFNSNPSLTGSAKYNVADKMNFKVAASIIQILPNGNMVIQGRQEIRLVNEVREVQVLGIIRREDIASSNTIQGEKISELRISYGGRGELTDMQAFPWGQQVLNKVMPF